MKTNKNQELLQAVSKEWSCMNCVHEEYQQTSYQTDEGESYCYKHEKLINDLFTNLDFDLSEIGCKQWEPEK
jgi:hypothetical protein